MGGGLDRPGRGRGVGPYALSGANPIRAAYVAEVLDFLRNDQRLIQVARIAREFRQDPVALLRDGGDEFETLVRLAAAQVVLDDKKKEAEAERAAARR